MLHFAYKNHHITPRWCYAYGLAEGIHDQKGNDR